MTIWWGVAILGWVLACTMLGALDDTLEQGASTRWLGAFIGFLAGAVSSAVVWMIVEVAAWP